MNNNIELYIGIDIGATNIRFLIYHVQNNICFPYIKKKFVSCRTAQEEIEKNICYVVETAITEHHYKVENIKGIGIVMAPNFDRQKGVITRWPNHPLWEQFKLKEYIQNRWGKEIHIHLEDDANGAAFGEYRYHQDLLRGKNCSYITISTGVGGGFILNDHLYLGEHGWAGEIGHTIFGNNKLPCSCGKNGCLQTLISGPAILKKFQKEFGLKYKVTELEEVSAMAQNGNIDAISVFKEAGDILAIFCTNLIELLDISCIILGGGVLQQGGCIMVERVKKYIEQQYGNSIRKIIVEKSDLEDMNGVIGGLALVCLKDNLKINFISAMKC